MLVFFELFYGPYQLHFLVESLDGQSVDLVDLALSALYLCVVIYLVRTV
jgi:hypothetical protein